MKLLFVPAKPLGFSFLTFEGFKLGKNFVSPKPLILSTEYSRGYNGDPLKCRFLK